MTNEVVEQFDDKDIMHYFVVVNNQGPNSDAMKQMKKYFGELQLQAPLRQPHAPGSHWRIPSPTGLAEFPEIGCLWRCGAEGRDTCWQARSLGLFVGQRCGCCMCCSAWL